MQESEICYDRGFHQLGHYLFVRDGCLAILQEKHTSEAKSFPC
jgi:hypothetical protein